MGTAMNKEEVFSLIEEYIASHRKEKNGKILSGDFYSEDRAQLIRLEEGQFQSIAFSCGFFLLLSTMMTIYQFLL